MNSSLKNILCQLFLFLASLQLAVTLLISLAIVLAVGTFYESVHDAETAKYYVYNTLWFYGLLGLLGVNILFAALSRYPWKRHHTGFLVVHAGLLIILTGSFVTLLQGYEGQLIVQEGETRDRIFLTQPQLFFFESAQKQIETVDATFRFDPPNQKSPFGAKVFGNILVKVDKYLPHAVGEEQVIPSQGLANPAIQIKINGSQAKLDRWIFSRDFSRQRLALGPASVSYLELPDVKTLNELISNESLRGPVLWVEGQLYPLQGNTGREFPLKKNNSLFVKNYLPHGVVYQDKLVNLSPDPDNPVVKVEIRPKKSSSSPETHIAFAKFPDLPTFHEQGHSQKFKLRLLWIPQELGKQNNEMILAKLDQSKTYYALKAKGKWKPVQEISLQQNIKTGWMDFKMELVQELQNAQVQKVYRKVPVVNAEKGPPPAIRLSLANEDAVESFWLSRGESQEIRLGSQLLKVAYALKSVPLGYQIKLNDFKMGLNEGTQDPASYESQITLLDEQQKINQDHRIAMNQPLSHGKYKIFQASYQLDKSGKDWSVFAVAYDPGIPIKYAGSIVLVLGIILIFFFRPAFLRKRVPTAKPDYTPSPTLTPALD